MKISVNIYITLSFLCYVTILFSKLVEYETIATYLIPFFVFLVFISAIVFNWPLEKKDGCYVWLLGLFASVIFFSILLHTGNIVCLLSAPHTYALLYIYYLQYNHFKK